MLVMRADRKLIADEILTSSRAHDAAQPDRLQRFRNVEPETAALLAFLVRCTGARRILEIGTSNGYSTIWLADAAEAAGGVVTSVEIDPERACTARENLLRAGLEVDLRTEDASDTLTRSAGARWDFVFLDADRSAYAGYWPDLLRTLRPRAGLLAIDNVLSHRDEVVELTAKIEAEPTAESVLVPVGAGLRLVRKS
jgi:predicted O-methyltransferase YrrM